MQLTTIVTGLTTIIAVSAFAIPVPVPKDLETRSILTIGEVYNAAKLLHPSYNVFGRQLLDNGIVRWDEAFGTALFIFSHLCIIVLTS
jgi:hypothetical protein